MRHTHANQVYQAWALNLLLKSKPGANLLFGMPLFHVGGSLTQVLLTLSSGGSLVVLSPSVSVIEWREEQRAKAGYVHFSPGALDEVLRRETAKIGYWLDSSAQTPDETVDDILANLDKAAV